MVETQVQTVNAPNHLKYIPYNNLKPSCR